MIESLRKNRRSYLLSAASVTFMLITWVLVTSLGWANELFLPGPEAVWNAFVKAATKGYQGSTLLEHVGMSLWRILVAFAIACIIGIPLGILMGASKDAASILNPFIEFYRPLPPLGLYTLLVMWLGIGEESKLALLFLAALSGIIITTVQAIQTIDPVYVRAAQALGANKRTILREVYLPAAGPMIL
ncbi:MAG: taurine transport system permease protein, partial [Pseudorhodobacter sp.]